MTPKNFSVAAAIGLAGLCFIAGAKAAVVSSAPNGFEVSETAHIAALPQQVYAAIGKVSRWWDAAHTFSKDASNLSLDMRAGGCWCERLPDGGSVEHMTVVWADPGKALRVRGALGPLQGMGVDGALTFTITQAGDGSDVEMRYAIGGYGAGLDKLAVPVDRVLGEQLAHLKAFAESRSP